MNTFEMYFYAIFFAIGLLSSAWWLYDHAWNLGAKIHDRIKAKRREAKIYKTALAMCRNGHVRRTTRDTFTIPDNWPEELKSRSRRHIVIDEEAS